MVSSSQPHLLVPILRAAHCRSTHHYFAIDALERIGTQRGRRLGELLLKYYPQYLKGAKAPDDSFKDFQNHVIHVQQNNWGGAPAACRQWLDQAMQHLRNEDWPQAAYACGVLSHYFTDPVMPLHTGQTQRESVVHRPMEWSICKAYEEIYALCQYNRAPYQVKLTQDANWMETAVLSVAQIANAHYDRLIEIYNLARGVADPPRGLTKEARSILADLFDLAIGGWASVLSRMAANMHSVPPDCSLTMATLIAAIDVPRAVIVRKFAHTAEAQAVARIFDEYTQTGTVESNLPQEIKVVRNELAKARQPSTASSTEAKTTSLPATTIEPAIIAPASIEPAIIAPASIEPATIAPIPLDATPAAAQTDSGGPIHGDRVGAVSAESFGSSVDTEQTMSTLSYDAPLVDAPSIGPKTAQRFVQIGITTVGQFLSADCGDMAQALQTGWINAELIADWQDQAQLVCEVPGLSGYKAQLLVAVDCRNTSDLASAPVSELLQAISEYCQTKDGQRILRSAKMPTRDEIDNWIESAKRAMAEGLSRSGQA